jgi:hypothetical protein
VVEEEGEDEVLVLVADPAPAELAEAAADVRLRSEGFCDEVLPAWDEAPEGLVLPAPVDCEEEPEVG